MSYASLTRYLKGEDGAGTPFAVFLVCIFIAIGGLAVDFQKAVSERTQMQLAADSAAHAALYSWEFNDPGTSTDTALATIEGMLPEVAYRDALRADDLEYGFWDPALQTFTPDPSFVEDKDLPLRSAVRAKAQLEAGRLNESRTLLLGIIGQESFTIRTSSIYASYYPPCFTEGFVADEEVNMQSNSIYLDGFCMHSNTHVSLNQNNFFEPGTVVSMPNLDDLELPASGFEKNEGLQAALRQGAYRLRILTQMSRMFDSLRTGNPEYAGLGGVQVFAAPIYPIHMGGNGANAGATEEEVIAAIAAMETDGNTAPFDALPRMSEVDKGKKTVVPLQFAPKHRIFRAECSGIGDITFSTGTYRDFVLITNCPINFANNVVLDGVLIATDGDVSGSQLQIGLDDNCATDGNAGIWTKGSFRVASGLQGYGAQILAWGDIEFAAQANGIEGVSFIAFGRIDGTSQNEMGYCNGQGTENFAAAPYYRMVQ